MVYLPDLSDGETSDGVGGIPAYEDTTDADFESPTSPQLHSFGSSNFNTLETMSARSFGFIKPSQKVRDNDMASRIRRHKSFFNADTSSITIATGKS